MEKKDSKTKTGASEPKAKKPAADKRSTESKDRRTVKDRRTGAKDRRTGAKKKG